MFWREADLRDGTLSFDVALHAIRGFLGIKLRAESNDEYEDFYFRPHKVGLSDALQYTPEYKQTSAWQLYHGPGFTAPARWPIGEWTSARIELLGDRAAFFVGSADQPALVVSRLARTDSSSAVGFWTFLPDGNPGDSLCVAHIANVRVERNRTRYQFPPAAPPVRAPGLITSWEVSPEVSLGAGDQLPTVNRWDTLFVEPHGVLVLNRYRQPPRRDVKTVVLRTRISSDSATSLPFEFGFSDDARVFLNGDLLYVGSNGFSYDGPRREGVVTLDHARLYLRLNRGDNDLRIVLSDASGGWGIIARAVPHPGVRVSGAMSAALVQTKVGWLAGVDSAVRVFRGIPFAKAPTGDLRWRPPQPFAWSSVRDAVEFGPACMQPLTMLAPRSGMSDDCLSLNIWTPAKSLGDRLPVLVWIHGGAYVAGGAAQPLYSGRELARRGIVVVTLNYRLGPFGYAAHPRFRDESPHRSTGNFGLLDQLAALRWVRENVSVFGGDSTRVTVAGHSSGAHSVLALLGSPLSAGLFHQAVIQSAGLHAVPMREPARHLEEFSRRLLGDDIQAARQRAARDIIDTFSALAVPPNGAAPRLPGTGTPPAGLWPFADGWVLPRDPDAVVQLRATHPVPILLGGTADEGAYWTKALQLPVRTVTAYRNALSQNYGAKGAELFGRYPVAGDSDVVDVVTRFLSDEYLLGIHRLACNLSRLNPRTYLYEFTRVNPMNRRRGWGAPHAAELPYVFGRIETTSGNFDAIDLRLSEAMLSYWTQFVKTGDPNVAGLPNWKPFDAVRGDFIKFSDRIEADSKQRHEAFEFLRAFFAGAVAC